MLEVSSAVLAASAVTSASWGGGSPGAVLGSISKYLKSIYSIGERKTSFAEEDTVQ